MLACLQFNDITKEKENHTCIVMQCEWKKSCMTESYMVLSGRQMSLVMRKPVFSICENKDADQLRGNREADQRLCFRYSDSTIPLLPESEISSL